MQLIMPIGLPLSGKTEWCKQQNIPIVSPAAIRKVMYGDQKLIPLLEDLIWFHTKIQVRSLFAAGNKKLILDATNITKAWRDQWDNHSWNRIFVAFAKSEQDCILRAHEVQRVDLIPTIRKYSKELVWPTPEEGPLYDGRTWTL